MIMKRAKLFSSYETKYVCMQCMAGQASNSQIRRGFYGTADLHTYGVIRDRYASPLLSCIGSPESFTGRCFASILVAILTSI
jgi:hypothetical protein